MPLINHAKGEINAKLVFVGPASAGKATNLNHIYAKLKESFRGKFKSMNLQNDRMLFFDFMPSGQGNVNGYSVRFHIYTITGEAAHPSSWKMVLKGADGLVFVADSGPDRMAANVASLGSVNDCLAAYGKTLSDIPCVIQCNKRDLPQALDPEGVGRSLGLENVPLLPAVASKGEGVLECIFSLVKLVLKNIRAGGLELEGQPEQLQRMTEPAHPARTGEQPAAGSVPEGGAETEAEAPAGARDVLQAAAAEEEPVVEVAGEAELLGGGGVRLPLAISYGGKVKRMTLAISLTPDRD